MKKIIILLLFITSVLNAQTVLQPKGGGTGNSTYSVGDILYATGSQTLSKLGIGSAGQVLSISGGVPTWTTSGSLSGGYIPLAGTDINHPVTGSILSKMGANAPTLYSKDTSLIIGWCYDKSSLFDPSKPYSGLLFDSTNWYFQHWNPQTQLSEEQYSHNGYFGQKINNYSNGKLNWFEQDTTGWLFTNTFNNNHGLVVSGVNHGQYLSSSCVDKFYSDSLYNLSRKPLSGTTVGSATVTINSNSYNYYTVSSMSVATTFSITGTPVSGQKLELAILDNGVSRSITFPSGIFDFSYFLPAPTATTAGKIFKFYLTYTTLGSLNKWIVDNYQDGF